ncbi:acryloyl-CoA reductase [Pontibacillus yanchengensis]|uniref:Acryloyl-CoA reductase n=2 Tax=Pontibacillus yanchengensis TaxID=462910 RepID=A0ACC7VBM8_9BACI|nr:acryloyl-CoA reductase [Pontibacillus yanchengensis]MYL35317.1 acryloyl-CoA reductase [Pontibacillus yanchengensis]MYL52346.1 acryloyl-CoA reductase [Pontibacillus yanchengensis]
MTFRALLATKQEDKVTTEIVQRTEADLPKGDVTIKVAYSSVNYKDGLATVPKSKVVPEYPMVPGIDLAGTVVDSADERYQEGDQVIVTSYELGVSHDGGFSEYARVKSEWIVPLPDGMNMKEAMTFGTAGFTAALSVHKLEQNGLTPEDGPILVQGATGGVGSMAVAMLSKRGFNVVASTGKESEANFLKSIGASDVISREDVTPEKVKPLQKQTWAGAVDPVGGKPLASVLSSMKYGGAVAVSGLTAGVEIPTTVMPFILRGVDLLGVDSVYCPMETRKEVWDRIATDLKPDQMNSIEHEISLEDLPQTLSDILQSKVKGRTVVRLGE